ncbi:MAG: LamG-like jellyroll fold domain-containing protein [archaeon]
MKLNNKGVSTIFTGIMIFVLSIVVMTIILAFVIPYINSLNEQIRYKQNKENIFWLNQELQELKNLDVNSYKNLDLQTTDEITIDSETNTIYITQQLKTDSFNNFKNQIFENITILRENNALVFTLDLDGIITLNKSTIVTNNRTIRFDISGIYNGIPIASFDENITNTYPELITPPAEPIFDITDYNSNLIINFDFTKGYNFNQIQEGKQTIVEDIIFNSNGANLNGTSSKIEIDKDLMLGSNDFTIETLIDNNYSGYLFSKTARIGGMDIFIDNNRIINTFAQGIEIPYNIISINVDDNYIYYIDTFYRLIKLNKSDYSYVTHIGYPINSGGDYEFVNPFQIAIFGDYLYVVDYGSSSAQIKIFRKNDLSFVRKLSVARSVTTTSGLSYPRGIAVDQNYLYISDSGNHRIMVRRLDDFSYVMHYGGYTAGAGQDQLSTPREIAVDDNYLYIADGANHRVMIRNKSDLSYVTHLGTTGTANTVATNFSTPVGIYVDNNFLYVAEYENHRIKKYEKGTWTLLSLRPSSGATSGNDFNRFVYPSSIAADSQGFVYVADSGNHRIIKSDSNLNFVSRFPDNQYTLRIADPENLSNPYGIAYDDGYIYISDYGNNRIIKKRADNLETVAMFGLSTLGAGSGTTGVNGPYDLTVDGDYLWVVDYGNSRMLRLNKSDLSYSATFGSSSTTTDEGFYLPRGVAVDENYIYITDGRNHRVKKHDKTTFAFVAKTTDSNYTNFGCGATQTYYPTGIAVDENYVYITEGSCPYRIKVLNKSDLSFVANYGWNYVTITTEAFSTALLMKLDGNNLYVADYSNNRIKKINTKNFFVSEIGTIGVLGYMPGELYGPWGVAVSPEKVYVTDTVNRRIVVYDRNLIDQNVLISGAKYDNNNFSAMDNNQFNQPNAVACDSNYLYVADTSNNRLVKLNKETGNADVVMGRPYLVASPTNSMDFYAPSGIAIDENYVYQTDNSVHILTKRNISDFTKIVAVGGSAKPATNTSLTYPRGVAVDSTYVYIADSSNNRIKVQNKSDLSYVGQFGTTGSGTANFNGPQDVAVDDNYIYVADYTNNRIKIHNKSSPYAYVTMFGVSGTGDANNLRNPIGVTVDDNFIYISDYSNHRIVKYDKYTYQYIGKLGGIAYNTDNNSFYYPLRLSLCNGELYVSDSGNYRIQVLDTNLNYLRTYGERSFGENQYLYPKGVFVDDNYIFIADTTNQSIVKRNKTDFSFVSRLGGPLIGATNDKFYNPYGIASDGTHIYVTDASYHRIKKFLVNDFNFVTSIGGTGAGTGNNQFYSPYSINIFGDNLFIADYSSNTIKVHNKSDLSFISRDYGMHGNSYYGPTGVTADENYFYVSETLSFNIKKIRKSDYRVVKEIKRYDENTSAGRYFTQSYNDVVPGAIFEIDVDENYLYAPDNSNHRIIVFNKTDLSYVGKIGYSGQGPLNFYNPYGVSVDDNYVYVSDSSSHRVVRRNKSDILTENNGYASGYNYLPFSLVSVVPIAQDSPTHLVIQRRGKYLCYYINGLKDNCIDVSINLNALNFDTKTWLMSIASKDDITNAKGSMKYFRLYDRSFTDSDINNMFNQVNLDYNISGNDRNLTTELLSYYNLDETSGAVLDSTGFRNGTIAGNTLQNQTGKIGTAYTFDGTGDYIDFGDNTITGNQDFTLTAWVKLNVNSKTQGAVSIGTATADLGAYLGFIATGYSYGNNNNVNYSYAGGFWNYNIGTGVNEYGDWTHIVMTYNAKASAIRLFVNGTEKISVNRTTLNLGTTTTRIGRILTDTSYDLNGQIDEVGIWARTLTPDEVSTLYNNGNGLTYPFTN